ncbi:hypothetical protein QTN25_005219 [Entamoeba marina]
MRFKKARKAGAYNQQHPASYEAKAKRSTTKQSISPKAVEVCVPVSCNSGDGLDTGCDFSDSHKIACADVPEKKCTAITTEKACKKDDKKNIVYVVAERNANSEKSYDVKAYKDHLCTKPYDFPVTTAVCKTNNLRTRKLSCNDEGMSLGVLCKCKNCGDTISPSKKKVEVKLNYWLWLFTPLIIGFSTYYLYSKNKKKH